MNDPDDVRWLIEWFRAEGADFPWRHTRDRYLVLVAETMLQATQSARVVPFYESWIERWPTAASLADAPLGDVLAAWHGLGYPRRARNLHRAATAIVADGWPSPERLTELPGVGPYTASAIRCFADEEPVLPIDTNIRRVLARRYPNGWPGTPPGWGWAVGQALMDFGRVWCTAKAPGCARGCPGHERCVAAATGTVDIVTPRARPQGRYEGSMRQRRGRLLAALAASGRTLIDDEEAAASLVADGLARRSTGVLERVE